MGIVSAVGASCRKLLCKKERESADASNLIFICTGAVNPDDLFASEPMTHLLRSTAFPFSRNVKWLSGILWGCCSTVESIAALDLCSPSHQKSKCHRGTTCRLLLSIFAPFSFNDVSTSVTLVNCRTVFESLGFLFAFSSILG